MVAILSKRIYSLVDFLHSGVIYMKAVLRNLNIVIKLKLRQESTVISD